MRLRVRLSFGSSSGCHVVYHLGDHVHPLGVSEGVNTIVDTGIRENDTPGCSTDDPVNNSRLHDLCGIYLEDS